MHDGSTPHSPCPLAREPDGTPIPLPDGASAWRVRRHTGGRPRLLLDAQKQPMKLPLSYHEGDLEEILPPGTYRLVLVDQRGEPLGPTVQISIGHLRNGADEGEEGEEEGPALPVIATLPPSTSDTRLVLEANVRSTQLAFQHNQRTLELGLRMADTLRESVQALTEAQAELMKSMASSRGFYRNAAPQVIVAPAQPPPAPALPAARADEANEEEEEDEDGDYDESAPAQNDLVETLKPLVAVAAQQIVTTIMGFTTGGNKSGSGVKLSEVLNWNKASASGKAARAAVLEAGEQADETASQEAIPSAKEMLADPKVQAHLFAIMTKLTPEEKEIATGLAKELSESEQARWFSQLKRLSVDDAVAKIRALVTSEPKAPAA